MTKCSTSVVAALLVLLMGSAAFGQEEKQWDALAKKVLAGETLSAETKAECSKQFLDYFNRLSEKNKAKDLFGFSDEDNAAHYVNAIKMAVIDPGQHGGWPVRHAGRGRAYEVIKKRLENEDDASLMAAAIIPAIDNDDPQFAIAVYRKLQTKDPAWAKYILTMVQQHYSDTSVANTFVEAFVPATPGEAKKSDAIGSQHYSECNGKSYLVRMTATALRASPELDISKPDLPKPMTEIIEIAFAKLETIAGTRKGWGHTNVTFRQPSWDCPDPALRRKWYCLVRFTTKVRREGVPYAMDESFDVAITVDGRLGGIWYDGESKVRVLK